MPGDSIRVTIEPDKPVTVESRLGFAVREDGCTVAAGTVSRLID